MSVAGVIVFGSDQEVAGVMAAVTRLNATDTFGWVGSDGWSARALVWEGRERAVEGTISVQPQANPVRGFTQYFLNLTVENNPRNPWFVGNSFHRIRTSSRARRRRRARRPGASTAQRPRPNSEYVSRQNSGRITSGAGTPAAPSRPSTRATSARARAASGSPSAPLSSRRSCSSSPTPC